MIQEEDNTITYVVVGIIVVIIIIAVLALFYFGAFAGPHRMPSSCTVGAGFGCSDAKATEDSIEMTMRNNMGEDIANLTLNFTGDAQTCSMAGTIESSAEFSSSCNKGCTFTSNDVFKNGKDMAHFKMTGCDFSGTSSTDFLITYSKLRENISHTVQGRANLMVES